MDSISNSPSLISGLGQQLLACCHQDKMEAIVIRRWRWWTGHVLWREPGNITCTARRQEQERKTKDLVTNHRDGDDPEGVV